MNNYDKVKLAIYENANITEDNRYRLLELLEERQNDNAEYVENVNKVFLTSYKKAAFDYKKDIKDIKTMIKNKEFVKARLKIKVAFKNLSDLEQIVDKVPQTITSTAISHCATILAGTGIDFVEEFLAYNLIFKKNKDSITKNANKIIDKTVPTNTMKRSLKRAVQATVNTKPSIKGSLKYATGRDIASTVSTSLIIGQNIRDSNTFKSMVKQQIYKERRTLEKLDDKLKIMGK